MNFGNGKEDGLLMLNQRYPCSAPSVQDVFIHKELTFVTEHADSDKTFSFWLVLTAGKETQAKETYPK